MEKILLTLIGRQRGEDGEELTTKTDTAADYYEKNGSRYFLYDETQEDTPMVAKNILKLKGGLLELTKRGTVTTHMVFEAGREYCTNYVTPYGCLKMEIATRSVESSFHDGEMKIRIDYALFSDHRFLSDCTLTIEAQPL